VSLNKLMMRRIIDRRTFIKGSSLAGVAGILATGKTAGAMMPGKGNKIEEQKSNAESNEDAPLRLSYNRDGKFKILQLADTHYISGDPLSVRALNNVNEMLDTEKPDLVIHTGDVIFGRPAEQSMRELLEPVSRRKIPFAVTFGNHDDEFDKTRKELLDIVRSIPYNITSTTKGIFGLTNYILTLGPSAGDSIDRVLYLFDSNAYSAIEGIKGYDHIRFDQIKWYRDKSADFTLNNGGKPLPSLAFFHIPLVEHKTAVRDEEAIMTGNRGEDVCSADVNSGLFVSMKEMRDVHAIFVGHDHDNDYALFWKNMFFIYGRYSGCDTVYNDLKPNGARVIELTSGQESFRSWIRLSGGSIIQDLKYPDDFLRK
jgi:3',5'-cyclic AMP phosphodiesterase CpdA